MKAKILIRNTYEPNDEFNCTTSEDSKNVLHNNAKDNLEDTKNLHENEIKLNKTFEAEVKARLVEPLDC